MPKKGEKARKIRSLSEGEHVRPPKLWFAHMKRRVAKEYPQYGKKRIGQIVGGIWTRMSTASKKKIIRKYQK